MNRSVSGECSPGDTAREVLSLCAELGFAAAGVCGVEPSVWEAEYRAWIASGRHGSMAYLAEGVDARLDPARLLMGARSALMVMDLYATRAAWGDPALAPGRGRIARYARGRDYHRVMKKRLHALADTLRVRYPGHEFRSFVDTAPVLERELAARCGLGWIGKHTLVIHERLGSWGLLGGFVTTLELDAPAEQTPAVDRCGSCTRCIDACPTGAIGAYTVDASRCISYLTIERRGPIDRELGERMDGWLYGCDVCQEVCPHNSPRPEGWAGEAELRAEYRARTDSFDLLEVLGWTAGQRRLAFTTSPMKRAALSVMKRNAVLAAGHWLRRGHDAGLRARLEEIARDDIEDGLVRDAARDVLAAIV